MKPILMSEVIVAIEEFNGQVAHWLRVARSGQPVIITQNGRAAGVLLSPIDFDRLGERQRFLESIASGVAEADAARLIDTQRLKSRLAARRAAQPDE
jgi:prevent-host-death family protein